MAPDPFLGLAASVAKFGVLRFYRSFQIRAATELNGPVLPFPHGAPNRKRLDHWTKLEIIDLTNRK